VVQGRYAYVTSQTNNAFNVYDLGGAYTQQLEAGGAEFGALSVDGNSLLAGDASIQGGLGVGGSAQIAGNLAASGNLFVQGTTSLVGGILGGATINGVSTPGAPTVTTNGTTGAQTWGYKIVAVTANGQTPAGTQGTTTSGNGVSTLTGSNFQSLSWAAVSGATSYKIYRTTLAATTPNPATTGLIGSTTGTTFNDTGLAGDSSTAPTLDTSGTLTVNGNSLFKPTTDSTTAFQIQNSSGSSLVSVDSLNGNITLNGANSGQLQAWTNAGNSGFLAREGASSVYANGYVYVMGGINGGSGSSTVQFAKVNADGTFGSWTTTNSMPGNKSYAGEAVYYNGYIYIAGGTTTSGSGGVDRSVYYAHVNKDASLTWFTVPAANDLGAGNAREGNLAQYNGYLYYVGGFTVGGSAVTTTQYAKINSDGTISAFTATNGLVNPRNGGAVFTANGYIYYVGGANGSLFTNVQYAPINTSGTLSAWIDQGATNPLPGGREGTGVAVMNGYAYVVAGFTSGSTVGNNVYYTQLPNGGALGAWTSQATNLVPTNLGDPAFANVNGYMYLIGADNGSGAAQTSVYVSSVSRVKISGALDLVGGNSKSLYDIGGGASLTAGNTDIVGTLQVQGALSLQSSLSVSGGSVFDSALFKNATDSGNAFQIQNSTGTTVFNVDTSNGLVGTAATSLASTNSQDFLLRTGNATGATSNSGSLKLDVGTATTTTGSILIGTVNTASAITLGSTAQTGAITLGQYNGASTSTINIGNNAGASSTQQVNIATSSSGINTVAIGSTNSSSATTIKAGTGNLNFNVTNTSNSGVLIKPAGGDSTAAFVVQKSGSTTNLLAADTTNMKITSGGDIVAAGASTATTATTSGTGTNTTTLVFSATTSFANGDVIFIDNAGQDYYTRIISGGTAASVTVSPAVTFENARTVTKYTVQNIGSASNATNDPANNDRFFQGFFTGGIVTGAHSTVYSDGNINSINAFQMTAPSFLLNATGASGTAFQIQNSSGKSLFAVDTTGNQIALGTAGASGQDGKIVFNNGTNTNTVSLVSGVTTGSYSLILPTTAPGTGQCLQTDGSVSNQLVFGACAGGSSPFTSTSGTITQTVANDQVNLVMNQAGDYGLKVSTSVAPTVDLVQITNSGNDNAKLYRWGYRCFDLQWSRT
jgi:hypothetical protein